MENSINFFLNHPLLRFCKRLWALGFPSGKSISSQLLLAQGMYYLKPGVQKVGTVSTGQNTFGWTK